MNAGIIHCAYNLSYNIFHRKYVSFQPQHIIFKLAKIELHTPEKLT